MKKYLYSLLLLTALTSQLNGMDRHYWLGGAQEDLEAAQAERAGSTEEALRSFKDIINNDGDWQEAVNEVAIFFQGDLDRIAQIMESNDSPLRLAVEANLPDVVSYIVENLAFLALPDAQAYLQEAIRFANANDADTIIIDELQNALLAVHHERMQRLRQALEQARAREIQALAALQEARQRTRAAEAIYRRLMNDLN